MGDDVQMDRRQFIKTSIFVLGYSLIPKLPAPLMTRESWVDDAIILYLRTPDSELLGFEITFNGHPIETYVIKMFKHDDGFIHEIKIPKIYNTPGKFSTYYEAQVAMRNSDISLTDEYGQKYRSLKNPDIITLKKIIPAGKYIEPKSPIIFHG
jgi:hypothetical protein